MKMPAFFENRSQSFWILAGTSLVIILGLVDFLTGYEFGFSLFYLAPISLAAWYGGRHPGLLIAAISAITWFMADFIGGNLYSNPFLASWNTFIRLGFFLVVAALLSALKNAFQVGQDLARIDFNTGAVSTRYFYELAQTEINRSQRSKKPLTLAYIDLDNFKHINDRLGHSIGDQVLHRVTEIVREQIRRTDIFARLGGDEFTLLLPETGQVEAQTVISRIFSTLLVGMQKKDWSVTFSIGVATFLTPPVSVDELVKTADQAMFTIKTKSKNGICYTVHTPSLSRSAGEHVPTKPRKTLFDQ